MISESPACLKLSKRGSGKLRRAARGVHLRQFDVKRPNRTVEELHQVAATRTERRQPVKLDYFRVADKLEVDRNLPTIHGLNPARESASDSGGAVH